MAKSDSSRPWPINEKVKLPWQSLSTNYMREIMTQHFVRYWYIVVQNWFEEETRDESNSVGMLPVLWDNHSPLPFLPFTH